MDGMGTRGNIIVIGATNRPSAIDPALRRPGRFDREIEIGVPDKKGRNEIVQIHTRNMPLAEDVDIKRLSDITHGYTGADISALSREAAMKALRRYMPEINLEEERVPPEILDKMVVKEDDFLSAYTEITPTAMREVYVEIPSVHWKEVGGLEEIKNELIQSVEWPLKKPEVFKRMGIKPPRGILLYGPPGCGKTLLARAVATESEANFISVKGPEIFSKWVGESEKAIREIFRKARTAAPAIIFFDELDSIIPRRGAGYSDSGASERVISQLLTEMDGIEALQNVVVIGATNRPDILDPAVMRPGRFDRLIDVPAPDSKALMQIFKIHAHDMPLSADVDLQEVAVKAKGYSGADVEALCREAAMNALRESIDAKEVTRKDFDKAMDTVRPSINPKMEEFYSQFNERSRKERATPPAIIS
jgi:transitional endoplasmic reticulum ATPase